VQLINGLNVNWCRSGIAGRQHNQSGSEDWEVYFMAQTWLITGCSSGLGKVLAEAVLARGDNLVATARNPEVLSDLIDRYPDTVRTCLLDVTQQGDAAAAVALAEQVFGTLDILVNNAGHGFIGAIEEATPDEYRPLFDANVFGLIETTQAALPALRRSRGHRRIVNLSSSAGIVGNAGFGYYAVTKFAVEGLSEALAKEVAPFGIAVIIVEPGPFRTQFLGSSINAAATQLPEYAETAGKMRAYRDSDNGNQAGDPSKAIAVMLKAIDVDAPPLHLPLGDRAYALAQAKFAAFKQDMDTWAAVATATGFDGQTSVETAIIFQ
jgi:NAD(P)-dependent dehydrogenase (short-subunit alcohol dehydrogenase family)